jgi:hypothetical protein
VAGPECMCDSLMTCRCAGDRPALSLVSIASYTGPVLPILTAALVASLACDTSKLDMRSVSGPGSTRLIAVVYTAVLTLEVWYTATLLFTKLLGTKAFDAGATDVRKPDDARSKHNEHAAFTSIAHSGSVQSIRPLGHLACAERCDAAEECYAAV